jgi:hypothetical protein
MCALPVAEDAKGIGEIAESKDNPRRVADPLPDLHCPLGPVPSRRHICPHLGGLTGVDEGAAQGHEVAPGLDERNGALDIAVALLGLSEQEVRCSPALHRFTQEPVAADRRGELGGALRRHELIPVAADEEGEVRPSKIERRKRGGRLRPGKKIDHRRDQRNPFLRRPAGTMSHTHQRRSPPCALEIPVGARELGGRAKVPQRLVIAPDYVED